MDPLVRMEDLVHMELSAPLVPVDPLDTLDQLYVYHSIFISFNSVFGYFANTTDLCCL